MHIFKFPFLKGQESLATAPLEFTEVVKEVKLMAQARGIRIHQYLDDWLLRAPSPAKCRLHTQTLLDLCRDLGWVVNLEKSELTPQQVFNFVDPSGEVEVSQKPGELYGPAIHVSHRSPYCHRETSLAGSPSHETNPMASKEALESARESGKSYPSSPFSPSPPRLVAERGVCSTRSTFAPSSTCPSNIYRCLKRRRLVTARKLPPHKLPGTKSRVFGPQEFRASLQGPDCPDSHGQHDCSVLHQQGGRYEIRLSLCPPMETSVLVPSQANCSEGKAYSRQIECDSRQVIPSQSNNSDGVVPVSAGVRSVVLEMGPTSGGSVCHPVQSQAPQVCISSSRFSGLGSGCLESPLGRAGSVCLPSSVPSKSGGFQNCGSRLPQDDTDSSRLAQHALVLGPGQSVCSTSSKSSTSQGTSHSTVQQVSTQQSPQPESSCLAPRASAIQEQGFSEEVAARIEAPQRVSTRAVYKSSGLFLSNGVNHTRWTSGRPL